EVRELFSGMVGAPASQIVVGENASLAMMHDCLVWAMLKGFASSPRPWSQEPQISFLCPVPGYDRHFAICEEYGVRMIPVPLTGNGPDMNVVEKLVVDPSVKGMWCVPKYANPTGDIHSDETIARLAAMRTGASDFRLFWDNAYAVHHLTERKHEIADLLQACADAGNPDRPLIFASTSKVTLAGAGLALFGSSPANVAWYLDRARRRTIGPDKLNQLRHVRFLRDAAGLSRLMEAHRQLIAPKFAAVDEALTRYLDGLGVAEWTRPEGGYFISVDARPGTAKAVVALAREIGLALTPAGSTWPLGNDPHDANLRIAPTFPTLDEVKVASTGIAICLLLAAIRNETTARAAG
ncbi:MAG TPA: aminotransferase class I/II-fold pyridoxal phosphate-dependent enzyme, partial [Saliniramus sp.]|nr:aminotransferase class I/II-fold pyridoxal phosphate-dependent enzyme [Saliniramus sp.]